LDFTQTEFRYNKKQHVDETWHIFTEFIKDFGDLCPEEFFTFLFFTTKLGRFGADVEDIAVSDEFVESISYSLSTLPSNTEKFMNLYNVADLLVERFSKEEAAELISVLDEKKFLSGSLAQTLFYRFPELKEGYGSLDLSGVPLKEILDNLEKFEAQAMNEAETLRPLDTNVGMEIEIKLAGVEQGRSVENSALRKKIEGTKTFWDFGVDGYEEAAELRTLDEGIPLNAKTSEKLRSDVRKLEQSNDVAAFATTHINVDSRILDEESSLIGFRKFDERRMEISAVPLSTSNHGLSFDASGYIDQMMIVGAFCDISISIKQKLSTINQLNDAEKVALLEEKPSSLTKLYLDLAFASGKPEIIPAILRAAKKKILPWIQTERIVPGISLSHVKQIMEDNRIDRAEWAAVFLSEIPFEEAENFITNECIDDGIREIVARKVQSSSFEKVRDLLVLH